MQDKLLRVHEVAELLQVTRQTIFRWRKSGHLPDYEKVGPKLIRWRESKIKEFMEQSKHNGGMNNE